MDTSPQIQDVKTYMDDDQEDVIDRDNEEVSEDTSPSEDQEETKPEEGQEGAEGTETQGEESATDSSKEDLTDRGTKVAREPESRFYQDLKNQNSDMKRLLGDPLALKEYLRGLEGTQAPGKGQEDDLADLESKVLTQNGQVDLKKLASYMDERLAKKLDAGIKYGVENRIQVERLRTSYDADKTNIRHDHPELDPKNKAFDPDLEQLIGERFIAQGGLQGKVTLPHVVDKTYKDIARFQGSGKRQANREITRKRAGAISQDRYSSEEGENEEEMSPAELLASRVRKSIQGR